MGPWSHEEEVETFRGDVDLSAAVTVIRDHELVFYDRYLQATRAMTGRTGRPLELFVLGRNEWRGESEWPLAGTEPTSYFLRSGARLDRDVPRPTRRRTGMHTTPTTRCRRSAASTRC